MKIGNLGILLVLASFVIATFVVMEMKNGEDYLTIASASINIDNDLPNNPPYIEILEPENGSIVTGSIIIKGKAWDIDGNKTLQKVEVKIDNGEWENATGILDWIYILDTKKLENGMHTVYARAYDGKDYSSIASIKIKVANKLGGGDATISMLLITIVAVNTAALITFAYRIGKISNELKHTVKKEDLHKEIEEEIRNHFSKKP